MGGGYCSYSTSTTHPSLIMRCMNYGWFRVNRESLAGDGSRGCTDHNSEGESARPSYSVLAVDSHYFVMTQLPQTLSSPSSLSASFYQHLMRFQDDASKEDLCFYDLWEGPWALVLQLILRLPTLRKSRTPSEPYMAS